MNSDLYYIYKLINGDYMAYKIVRYYQAHDKREKVMKRGLTKKEAIAHCNKDSSKGKGWFDAWTKQ